MTGRKFYKTVVQVEILSETPLNDNVIDLDTIHYNITEGEWSGKVSLKSIHPLNGQEAANALRNQDSSPEFFRLTENGEDTK